MKIGGLNRSIGAGNKVGCVLALDFKHKDGDSFMDRSVYGHLCTNHGSKWQLDGRYFDGVNACVGVPHHSALNIPSVVTASILIKRDTKTANYGESLISKRLAAAEGGDGTQCNYQFYLAANANRRMRFYDGAAEREVVYEPLVGMQVPLCFQIADGKFTAYANGDKKGDIAGTMGATNTSTLWVGFYDHPNTNEPFHGTISRVRLHRFADYAPRILSRSIGG